jgi:hypothetical protein
VREILRVNPANSTGWKGHDWRDLAAFHKTRHMVDSFAPRQRSGRIKWYVPLACPQPEFNQEGGFNCVCVPFA